MTQTTTPGVRLPRGQPDVSGAPTVAIETHGCKLNQADSWELAADFVKAGYRLAGRNEPADVYLVNTCTVTHVADRKARQALRSARRGHPDATVVATGCYAQRAPEALISLPEVDLVAGNTEKADLVRRVIQMRGEESGPCATGADTEDVGVGVGMTRSRVMVKIQEGCNQVCAYCIVPKVRGRERSIPPAQLIRRIREQLAAGYKEVVLTGTQLGSYGFDLQGIDLTGLLKLILSESDVPRLRVSSLQPQEIDDALLCLWSDPRLCPHFHLPLQSGSDRVLRRMRRRYTTERYMKAVDMIRASAPRASVTADVIVGFPGESEADFERTYAFCEEVGFSAMHVFPYSVRPGTSAAHFDSKVDPETKASGMRRLLSLAESQYAAFRERSLGTTCTVLWEERKKGRGPDLWSGLTDNYIKVLGRSRRPLAGRITLARLRRQTKDLVMAQVLRDVA